MKVVIKINHENFEYEINKNKKKKLIEELDTESKLTKFQSDSHSDYLYYMIKEDLGIEKGSYYLKYKNCELYNDENLMKILNEDELCYLDLEWNDFLSNISKININNKIYKIPSEVLNDSKLLIGNSESNEIIYFKNKCLFKNNLINDWIRISLKLKKYIKDNKIHSFSIPKPILEGYFYENKEEILLNYVGKDVNNFLNKQSLENLKDLAEAFEYLQIENLLEIVCASIAVRFIHGKNVEDIKKLGII